MTWKNWWSFSVSTMTPSLAIWAGIESEPNVCHWPTGGKLSGSPQRLARHPTSRSLEIVGEGLWRTSLVHWQKVELISLGSCLSQWREQSRPRCGKVVIQMWWDHRFLSGHYRISSCHSCQHILGSHMLHFPAKMSCIWRSFSWMVVRMFYSIHLLTKKSNKLN